MPFGLTNALTVFQHMMNNIVREYLDHFMVIYLDDIVFSSKSEKCEFDQTSIEFLGYMISPTGITIDERKVVTITDWPLPIRLKEV